MSENTKTTPYQCNFCRKSLSKLPIEPPDWPWLLVLMRPCQCPHCFVVYRRPVYLISLLPGAKWFANQFTGERKNKKGMLSSSDVGGPAAKFVAGMGRSVQAAEETIGGFFSVLFSAIWGAITWLPNLALGKKRRRKRSRGKGKFLKSK